MGGRRREVDDRPLTYARLLPYDLLTIPQKEVSARELKPPPLPPRPSPPWPPLGGPAFTKAARTRATSPEPDPQGEPSARLGGESGGLWRRLKTLKIQG